MRALSEGVVATSQPPLSSYIYYFIKIIYVYPTISHYCKDSRPRKLESCSYCCSYFYSSFHCAFYRLWSSHDRPLCCHFNSTAWTWCSDSTYLGTIYWSDSVYHLALKT